MDIGKIIRTARKAKRWTLEELASRVGSDTGNLSRFERGQQGASQELLQKLLAELGITLADAASAEPTANIQPTLQPSRAPKEYPVISWVIAGERALSLDAYSPGVAEEWLASTESAGPHGYWLIVRGPSMTSPSPPSFPEGTPILVQPEGFDLVSGKFYIAKHRDGETTFKQYIYDSGREYLVPLNKEFKQVEMDDQWDIIGRVIDMKAPKGVL
ncbi:MULTISPECIES: helix-turn-helix domain-containing protein [Pseudomonadaceae]|uniref:helix-turn-helix domain-containing protein n=1 Tax=Pseudomonadaceae TaxID=135621 RepID=UPI00084BB549|nr:MULTISPECIES: XRE family transcriptional regulator [Pseudomonas]OEC59462.1 repressor [Pseudomonas sp. ENNP23]